MNLTASSFINSRAAGTLTVQDGERSKPVQMASPEARE